MYYLNVLILIFICHIAECTLAVTPQTSSERPSFQKMDKKSLEALVKARSEAQMRRLKNTLSLHLTRHDDYRRILQKIRLEVEK